MRGRQAIGPEIAERMDGSPLAQTRLRVVLETIAGRKAVQAACEELHICEQFFERIRAKAMQAAATSMELKAAGRPRKCRSAADAAIAELRDRIADLEARLQAAEIRAELASQLPRLSKSDGKKR